jgi:hypothetical protein
MSGFIFSIDEPAKSLGIKTDYTPSTVDSLTFLLPQVTIANFGYTV